MNIVPYPEVDKTTKFKLTHSQEGNSRAKIEIYFLNASSKRDIFVRLLQ